MSEYFQVLRRIEAEHGAPPHPAEEEPRSPSRLVIAPRRAPSPAATPAAVPPVAPPPDPDRFAGLFERLRAAVDGGPLRSVVLAPVSTVEDVHAVGVGLLEHVERRRMQGRLFTLTESAGRPTLLSHDGSESAPPRIDPNGAWPEAVGTWLHLVPHADLLIVEGGPLSQSLDAARLAGVCDGLVIVVRAGSTRRDDLQSAVERARDTGCRLLGVVLHGA